LPSRPFALAETGTRLLGVHRVCRQAEDIGLDPYRIIESKQRVVVA
jgi:hypothetical protein